MAWLRFMDFVRRSILPVSAGIFLAAGSANAGIAFTKTTIGGFNNPAHILSADLNSDNSPDLAVANWNGNTLTILLGDGLGGYSVASTLTTATHPNFIAAGDFDNDGSLDLAVTNGGTRALSLFLNNGNGTAWTASTIPINDGADLTGVVAANFTPSSDSNIDLFFTLDSSLFNDGYEVWQGNGSESFSNITNGDTGTTPLFAAKGDFNGDAILDMAVANYDSGSISILLGNGNGTFSGASEPFLSVGLHPSAIAAGNLNGDSHPDLAVSNSGDNTVSILLGNGNGTFTQGTAIVSSGVVTSPAIADFDGDGAKDIAISRNSANIVSIFRGNGDGTFQPVAVDITGVGTPGSIAISDLNGDGSPDLAVTSSASNCVVVLMNVTSQITDGLVAWWRGEGNALDVIGGNNGSWIGSGTYAAGKTGQAFQLNGSDQTIAVPDGIVPSTSRYFTVSAWVYADSVTGAHYIFYGGANAGEYVLSVSDGIVYMSVQLASSSWRSVASSSTVAAGSWHHVTGVRRGTAIEIWVDGELKGSQTIPDEDLLIASWAPGLFPSRIGAYHHDSGVDMYRWDGVIDEVTIYDRDLSPKEILRLYDPNGPVAWWKGEGNSGDSIGDNDGDLQGAATFAAGHAGQAFSLSSATHDGVTVESSDELNPTDAITMSAWVRPTATSNEWPYIIGKRLDSGDIQYSITISDRNTLHCDITGAGVSAEGGAVPLNQWSHVACTYDRNTLRLYVNGEQVASAPGSSAIAASDEPLTIGRLDGYDTRNFDGMIDEVKIYNRALSASEVANSYGMVSWWKGANNAFDSAGANNGSWNGTPSYTPGIAGEAFSFDGSGNSVTVPASSAWAFGTGDFAISFWAYSDAFSDHLPLINNRKTGASDNMWAVEIYPVANRVEFHSGLTIFLTATNLLTSSSWNHIAVTRSGATLSIYINGVPSGSVSNSSDFSEINDLQIGRDIMSGNDLGGKSFQGLIDDVRIYNRSLSAAEVTMLANIPDAFSFASQTGMPLNTPIVSNPITVAGINNAAPISITACTSAPCDYKVNASSWTSLPGEVNNGDTVTMRQTSSSKNSTLTTAILTIGGVSAAFDVTTAAASDPNASGLVSWWKAENNAYDSVGGNHGTTQGGTVYDAGREGQAFSFDGSYSYVSVPNNGSVNYGSTRSFEMWIYPKVTAGFRGLLAKGYYSYSHIFSLFNGHLALYDGGAWRTGTAVLSANTWHHVAFVQDASTVTMYLNGVLDGTANVSWTSTSDFLEIGSFNHSDYNDTFNGLIDEVKIYNRVLSVAEISQQAGTRPDSFAFTPVTGAARSTLVESESITVAGISQPASISITVGEYQVNGSGTWSATPGLFNPGETVKVRLTSSASFNTTTIATLTIGGVSGTFSVTTLVDTEKPVVNVFTLNTAESTTMAVAVASLSATDNDTHIDYLITDSNTPPSGENPAWSATALPMTVTLNMAGNNFLYAWAKDPAGNVSDPLAATVFLRPVRRGTSSYTYYESLSGSCGDAVSGETVKSLAVTIPGSVTISGGKAFNLSGGYPDGYGTQNGFTVIQGTLTVATGSLTVDRITIR